MNNPQMNESILLAWSQPGDATKRVRRSPARWLASSLSVLCLGLGFTSMANAKDVYLKAQPYTKTITLPDASTKTVPMWGFADCGTDSTFSDANCTLDPDAAGPQISADIGSGDTALTIHLNNALAVPVSIVIPGQFGGGDPTRVVDAKGRSRMQSMTHETAPGTTGTYSWSSLRTGTYLYQSGTHPSIQVPMGLYGALTVVNGTAAYTGITANKEAVMLLSEVDPVQNARVAASGLTAPTEKCVRMSDYRANGTLGYPCTIDYNPIYFLVNGTTKPDTPPQLTDGTTEQTVLIRFLNAGLRSHTPAFAGLELSLVAEDGYKYPGQPRKQASALLAAGKTMDALVTAPAFADPTTQGVTWSLYDSMSSFSNEADINGTALASFNIGNGTPVVDSALNAKPDTYAVTEDTPLATTATNGVLANDTGLTGAAMSVKPVNGSLTLAADGSFTYTPNPNFSGTDTFMYTAVDAAQKTYNALVTLNVSFENDAPTGNNDSYTNNLYNKIAVDAAHGVLGNDSDVDGDTLTVASNTQPASGTVTMQADGQFTYIYTGTSPAAANTSDSFTYRMTDGTLTSDPITVALTINPMGDVTLNVVEFGSNSAIPTYRWIVQEDKTYHLEPGVTPILDQQTLNLHKSTMPVIAQGCIGCVDAAGQRTDTPFNAAVLDPGKYYYVSVLPTDASQADGHTIGGAQILPGQKSVTVVVNKQPVQTAQIFVDIFEDISPINGVHDANEPGFGGATVVLEDGGGRYGISAGIMSQDAYGNPLKNSLNCFGSYTPPTGVIESCPDTPENQAAGIVGHVLIKDLAPGKYGVTALPPASQKSWVQTSTIEGTKIIDAWVKSGEPPYFVEFGVAGPHAFIGFANPEHTCFGPAPCATPALATGTATYDITGHVTAFHDPRPPAAAGSVTTGTYDAFSHTRAWVSLNSIAGDGTAVATVQADEEGNFTINGIPNGNYQLVVWDTYLDQIISFQTVNVAGASVAVGEVAVPNWFTRSEHNVFLDDACGGKPGDPGYADGIRQPCEVGLSDQNINIRWRDGTVFQSFPTDLTGFVPFDETFPFFSWQIFEVDYLRHKPTGVTITVDAGGPVDPAVSTIMTPQFQDFSNRTTYPGMFADNEACTDASCLSRTETGSTVLLEAFQSFPGQTLMFDWGKVPYQPGENGGISGIVSYATTRAENDPRLTVMEPWEPGIADVKLRLYRVIQRNPAEVDTNVAPLDDFPGPGDIDVNNDGIYQGPELLTLVKETVTDSWDKNIPNGCQGEKKDDPFTMVTLTDNGNSPENYYRCYDGFRNWNQVRPGVFDGGYAFNDIPPGKYVVEVMVKDGYELYKEESNNVTTGDTYGTGTTGVAPVAVVLANGTLVTVVPDQAMIQAAQGKEAGVAQPPCVGKYHKVPATLSLFDNEPAPFADAWRPLCDRKEVVLADQGQAAADFHLYTSAPVAAQFTGLTTNDIAVETDPKSPSYGEKASPPYMPVVIRDFNGTEVYKMTTDAYGRYNGLLPSTFSANVPMPSGYSPAMMQICLNEAGPTKLKNYLSACNTLQFMPGTNTYADTPTLPSAAFSDGYNQPDCAMPEATPMIAEVNSLPNGNGPSAVGTSSFGPLIAPGATIEIVSPGQGVTVPNPAYEGPLATTAPFNQPTITRDYDFGRLKGNGAVPPTVHLVLANGDVVPLAIQSQGSNRNRLLVTAPTTPMTGQLVVTRGDNGKRTTNAVTVTIGTETPVRVTQGQSIQAAIDTAAPGQLILVGPGTYNEQVIMHKPVRLQGSGSTTVINALLTGSLQAWRDKLATVPYDLPGGQLAITEEGAGVTVVARRVGANNPNGFLANASRIDGFTITNASNGGGILVTGYAHNLEISNNNIDGNSGQLSGGIRIGQPFLPTLTPNANGVITFNNHVNIHNNAITSNGALFFESAGGGVSINTGTSNYTVARNFICGNYTQGDGAGIGHLGVSVNGHIEGNTILFNESKNVSLNQHGGGIFVGGEPGVPPALSLGSGTVFIEGNLIQGNSAGSGQGGGISTRNVNGAEITVRTNSKGVPQPWLIRMTNNMVVNNVAAWAGGGIAMQDTIRAQISNNTVADNDSTATLGQLVNVATNTSPFQPAGVVVNLNSPALAAVVSSTLDFGNYNAAISSPIRFDNNIIWHNRSFHYDAASVSGLTPSLTPAAVGECAAGANYWDLGVLGDLDQAAGTRPGSRLDPRRSVLTNRTGYAANNVTGNPLFISDYCNGSRTMSVPGPIQAKMALAEGGNAVDVRFGPLVTGYDATTQYHVGASGSDVAPWNYHISAGSSAIDNGNDTTKFVPADIDGNTRPIGTGTPSGVDRGADEFAP